MPINMMISETNSINICEISSVYEDSGIFVVMTNGNTFSTHFTSVEEFWLEVKEHIDDVCNN